MTESRLTNTKLDKQKNEYEKLKANDSIRNY